MDNNEFKPLNLFDIDSSMDTENTDVEEVIFDESKTDKTIEMPIDEDASTLKDIQEVEEQLELPVINDYNVQNERTTIEDAPTENDITSESDNGIATKSLQEISDKLDALSKHFTEKIKHTEHEEKIVNQMHAELQKYKEDMYTQLIRPVLLDIIEVRDSILRIANTYIIKPEGERDIPNKTFSEYALDIQDILEKNGIDIYKSNIGDNFVPVKQRAIKKIASDNPDMHGKIAESLSSGYNYNGRTIAAEKIAVYYYEKTIEIVE